MAARHFQFRQMARTIAATETGFGGTTTAGMQGLVPVIISDSMISTTLSVSLPTMILIPHDSTTSELALLEVLRWYIRFIRVALKATNNDPDDGME